jgi:hypothetical protein
LKRSKISGPSFLHLSKEDLLGINLELQIISYEEYLRMGLVEEPKYKKISDLCKSRDVIFEPIKI